MKLECGPSTQGTTLMTTRRSEVFAMTLGGVAKRIGIISADELI